MNNTIIFMALGGTIPFGIYLLLRYKMQLHYRYPAWMYGLLKLSIFFYLFPVPVFSREIKAFLRILLNDDTLFRRPLPPENVEIPLDMGKYFQKLSDGRVVFPQYKTVFLVAGMIWLCVLIGLLVRYYRNYCLQRKRILANSYQPDAGFLEYCETVRKELSIKRPVQILVMDGEFTPFTLGVFRPIVVFPSGYPRNHVRLVLMHEYIHIKKYHALVQMLGNIVVIIHWYLLFAHFLLRELNTMAELDCDYSVSSLLSEQQVKLYGHLIIDSNEIKQKITQMQSPFISSFHTPSRKLTRERLTMLKNRSQKKMPVLLAFMILTAFGSTVSAAGRQELKVIESTDNHISKNLSFTAGKSQSPSHSFVAGTAKEHVLHANGGCTVYTYNATYCTECECVSNGGSTSYVIYDVCPHHLTS